MLPLLMFSFLLWEFAWQDSSMRRHVVLVESFASWLDVSSQPTVRWRNHPRPKNPFHSPATFGLSMVTPQQRSTSTTAKEAPMHSSKQLSSRRSIFLQSGLGMGLLLGPTTNSRLANAFQPIPLAWAETNSMEESTKTIVSNDNDRTNFGDTTSSSYDVERRVAAFLKHVPTFTLVDDQGVPFMVVGEDAKVTAYLFTTYNEAERILRMATQSAERALQEERLEQRQQEQERRSKQDVEQASTPTNDEKDDLLSINSNKNNSKKSNPWKAARISTVTLETAVSLALQTAKTKGNYFLLAATAGDIEDALEITGQSDLAEGRVPLFYYQDFTINSTTTNGSSTIQTNPLFFQKKQLEAAYRKANPGQTALPSTVLVTELFAVIQDMVRTTSALDDDDYEKNYASLVLVPPPDSAKRAEQCRRRKTTDGATPPPLVLGKRNLVL